MTKQSGQLPYAPTEAHRDIVARLAAGGIPQLTICRFVPNPATNEPIGLSTLKRHFRAELDDGMRVANAALVSKCYEVAMTGNVTMLIWLTKTRMGWKEPATDVNLRQSYEELVREAAKVPRPESPALKVVTGGRQD